LSRVTALQQHTLRRTNFKEKWAGRKVFSPTISVYRAQETGDAKITLPEQLFSKRYSTA
jgi:hypothetical protein